MDRRQFIGAGIALGTALALPARLAAQTASLSARDRKLFAIAEEGLAKHGNILWHRDVVGVADFGVHSAHPRLHFVDFDNNRVRSYLCAHGTGSDPQHDGWLKWFSNVEGSNATSRGAYFTRGWYEGRYGVSIRLDGLDDTNSNALDRAIVMHQARYARESHVERWGRLGRSNGCFAMDPADFDEARLHLAGGKLLLADSYGIGHDGEKVIPPWQQAEILQDDPPRDEQRDNPGVY
ncbi:murein L,D-transpeptidase catalytic domain-containing protein [Pseudoblastomonas halimionae]|uniref:Twin-arginine translocation pathway signal n=1 Tax=Alteriqipengyuania halimionae TaxID=1926630 RepID=A0A6I4U3M1_9SPHN|nr:murein L,D-transpeptidase catalytic domain family protein [Alteriqipengyuania halimionae]MXP10610.1 twin-arginine translocation pathway signal [Alteriqipengyuania halimionae]